MFSLFSKSPLTFHSYRWENLSSTINNQLFAAVLLSACFLTAATANAANEERPNIILILADDLGIGNVGCYGSDHYKTPRIDELASSGTRFTKAFTASLCGPSRALIMTGRYAFRNGSTNQDACMLLPQSELQLGRIFKTAGYKTSAIGKWGQLPGEPDEAGFDDYLRFNGSGVYWNKSPNKSEGYRVNGEERKLGEKEYMPDLMQAQAINFIKKNSSTPFFLYYSMVHVHGDIQPTPDSLPDSKDLFSDNILYMDKLVGNLVNELETLKIRENTLIIFMGDNGTGKGQDPLSTIGGRNLSGMKGSMLECGGLVPMIASWPGQTPAGKVSADLVDSTDLITTFAELAGAALPKKTVFDGHSIAPQLRGKAGKPRNWVFNQLARMWYVRDAHFKLNHLGELYDMSGAPFLETLVEVDHQSPEAKAARARLSAVLIELDPAGGIVDRGDGSGRHANKVKKETTKNSDPAIPSVASDENERGKRFDRIDKEKAGKLTRETYAARQSDAESAGKRFDKWNADKDGFMTREEYIYQGQKRAQSPTPLNR